MSDPVCMLGLPGSGKTSFLAALYELLSHPLERGELQLNALPEERAYLQAIHEKWLVCEPATRTSGKEALRAIGFEVVTPDGELRSVSVPDVAGEAVRALWEERRWVDELRALVSGASGILLFVRVNDIKPARRVQRLVETSDATYRTQGQDEHAFDPESAPTQAKLVDLLEGVLRLNPRAPLPIVLMLSAWDAVDDQDVSPEDFLRLQLPLLWQYLTANPECWRLRVIGVSAQGGDFRDQEVVRELRALDPPSRRLLVVHGEVRSHNVALPLEWLWRSS